MTPMAANFNLVPAALLELKNPYGSSKCRSLAIPLLAVNILFNTVALCVYSAAFNFRSP